MQLIPTIKIYQPTTDIWGQLGGFGEALYISFAAWAPSGKCLIRLRKAHQLYLATWRSSAVKIEAKQLRSIQIHPDP